MLMFLKEVSYTHQYIYLIQNTVKKGVIFRNIITISNKCFLF